MRKFILVSALLYVGFVAGAQKLPATLLWKISGNSLNKPSYLFGTMHLSDERLFQLGDSLYKAIESSEGFAIEVNPDDMTGYLIEGVKKEIKNSRRIQEMLDENKFKRYSEALSKKLKKPAEEITARDIFSEKNKWVSESYRKGKMSTFLDAYLYDIARRQGKWTGGVEDMDDQKDIVDNLIDESDIDQIVADAEGGANSGKALERFIKVYLSGDLNIIDSISNNADSAYIDALLIKRNIKMARRMDSLSALRSMVFAVGAAHLPGSSGLINLLRKKGFEVQPVFSSRKIKPDAYKVKEIEVPWIPVQDENGFYSALMPGKPGDVRMLGLYEMKMYFDIFNSTGYLTAGINTPYDKKDMDSVVQLAITNIFGKNVIKKAKPLTINGINGREVEKTDSEGYKKGYFLNKGNVVYMAVAFAMKRDNKSTEALDKFLRSFKPIEKDFTAQLKLYTHIDSTMAYRVDLPSKPGSGSELTEGNTDKSVKSHLSICTDPQTGAYYFFGVNEAAPGYYIENDSITLNNIRKNNGDRYARITTDTMYIKNNHRVMELNGIMSNANLNMRAYYEFRGNRWYALVSVYDSSRSWQMTNRFFNSFQLLDYPSLKWGKHVSGDGKISTWSPAPFRYIVPDSADQYTGMVKHETFDSTRSDSYIIIPEYLGKYYWQPGDSIFWEKIAGNLKGYTDSLLEKKRITSNDMNGIEILLRGNGAMNVTRKASYLYGDSIYTIIAVLPQERIHDYNADKFFSDFRFSKKAPPSTILNSKAALVLTDLTSSDSSTRLAAIVALTSAPFSKIDLPLLHQALLKQYEDSSDYESVNDKIANYIRVINDTSSLHFAISKYKSVSDPDKKNIMLEIISGYKTTENYATLKTLLLQEPPVKEPSYTFSNNLEDSLLLASAIIKDLFPLLKDSAMAPTLTDLANTLIDSSMISKTEVVPYEQLILRFAENRYKANQRGDDFSYKDYSLIRLLGKFNNAACNIMLQKWLLLDDDYLKMECIEALLLNNQPVASKVFQKLAQKNAYRVDLYEKLKKHKKKNLFPSEFLTQKSFAESMIFVSGSDDYEPTGMTYLTQKTVLFQGKKARFYFYKITYGEDEYKSYNLGCAGPFNIDVSKISDGVAEGAVYFEEEFDPANLQGQIEALIKKWKNGTNP